MPNNHKWARFPETKIGLEMKGFFAVTDNDWFAWVTLLNQDWPKAPWCNMLRIARGKQGVRLKAITSHWAKARM